MKKKDMMMWYIETRLTELSKIGVAATKDTLMNAHNEYKRLHGGIYWYLKDAQSKQSLVTSNQVFEWIQDILAKNIRLLKEQMIAHINNNHIPQEIDMINFKRCVAIQQDWQQYMNKIQHIKDDN